MAWYTSHTLRYRGRLLAVESRYGYFNGAYVVKGRPLNLQHGSRDHRKVARLFNRNQRIQQEIKSDAKGYYDYALGDRPRRA